MSRAETLPLPLGALAPQPGMPWEGLGANLETDVLSAELRAKVAVYLKSCPIFLAWMEYTRDVLGDRFGVDGGSAIASDGVFYWRVDAAAYVGEYGVGIPDKALAHMTATNWTPPSLTRDQYLALYRKLVAMLVTEF